MKQSDHLVRADDGFALAATLFEPDEPRSFPSVIVAGATGVRRGYYEKFARHLAETGFAAITFDYRGVGGSRPPSLRGFEARMRDWGEKDLNAVIGWIAQRSPGAPIQIVGHSVGGQIPGFAANRDRIGAMAFVAAQAGYWGNWSGHRRLAVALLWHGVIPVSTRVLGYFLASRLGLGEDLPGGVASEWARWGRSRNYLFDHVDDATRNAYESLSVPLRAYSFTDDEYYAPHNAVGHLLSYYASASKEWLHLHPRDRGLSSIGHFGFFRSRVGAVIWPELEAWLRERAR